MFQKPIDIIKQWSYTNFNGNWNKFWNNTEARMANYSASYSSANGNKGYTVTFRHPVVLDKSGKYGKKIHKGLGTRNESVAKKLVNELNELLANDSYWELSKKSYALNKFTESIVEMFYSPMEEQVITEKEILDNNILIPSREQGYKKSLLLGPSGVGKTTLLRLMAGTIKEGFPSTATCRTTTCNQEIICGDFKEYEAIITFMSKDLFSQYIIECIEEACRLFIESQRSDKRVTDKEIAQKLFNHKDLIIRLAYILGEYREEEQSEFDEFDEEDWCETDNELQQLFENYIKSIKEISEDLMQSDPEFDVNNYSYEENDAILLLCEDIVSEVQKKFALLTGGKVVSSIGKWVTGYYIKTDNRNTFFDLVKKFSSNNKYEWGKLLSPLVKTIRICGDFRPEFCNEPIKLVIYDGMGLGHATISITSVPTDVMEKYSEVDSIILVDDATQPLMENSKTALKDVIFSGYADKTLMCYTHIDEMKGDNFIRTQDKVNHVNIALSAYLTELRKQNVNAFSSLEEQEILSSCYYFSDLANENISKMSQKQLLKVLNAIHERFRSRVSFEDVVIKYDEMTLYHHLQNAIDKFRKEWGNIIGYPYTTSETEHWSRIKALTRRLAYFDEDNYNHELQPLADLARCIKEELNSYLNKPMAISMLDMSDEKVIKKINYMKGQMNDGFLKFVRTELWKKEGRLEKWRNAYSHVGRGSTYERAVDINAIFDLGAPRIGNFVYEMNEIQKMYISALLEIVQQVLSENNCELLKFEYADGKRG